MEKQIEILRNFELRYWTTQSGSKIQIKDLTIDHLKNIVKMLKKRCNEANNPMNDFPSFQGEMAQLCAEREWKNACDDFNEKKRLYQLFNIYYKLKSL